MDDLEVLSNLSGEGWFGRFLGEIGPGGFPLTSASPGFEASRVVKSGSGALFGVGGFNNKGSAQFILIFDATALPANGAVPVGPPITVPAGNNFSVDFGIWGLGFRGGCVIANSSTANTLTVGSADVFFSARYV